MGRPPRTTESTDAQLKIRLTQSELADLTKAADGKPVSTWGREELLRVARKKNGEGEPEPARKKVAKRAGRKKAGGEA